MHVLTSTDARRAGVLRPGPVQRADASMRRTWCTGTDRALRTFHPRPGWCGPTLIWIVDLDQGARRLLGGQMRQCNIDLRGVETDARPVNTAKGASRPGAGPDNSGAANGLAGQRDADNASNARPRDRARHSCRFVPGLHRFRRRIAPIPLPGRDCRHPGGSTPDRGVPAGLGLTRLVLCGGDLRPGPGTAAVAPPAQAVCCACLTDAGAVARCCVAPQSRIPAPGESR